MVRAGPAAGDPARTSSRAVGDPIRLGRLAVTPLGGSSPPCADRCDTITRSACAAPPSGSTLDEIDQVEHRLEHAEAQFGDGHALMDVADAAGVDETVT